MAKSEQNHLRLTSLEIEKIPKNSLYIGSAGFEDRSLGFLQMAANGKRKFDNCIAIEYRPLNLTNRKADFAGLAAEVFSSVEWRIYDRKCPENFTQAMNGIIQISRSVSRIVVDISGMSKMLIVVLLYGLRETELPLSIIYAPARTYHPLKESYEKEKDKSKFSDHFPYFLTTDVYNVVTTTKLSSIAMQGSPLAMIAFPNFNHLEMSALLNETNAQKLFLIESISDPKQNSWRLEAIRWINRGVRKYVNPVLYKVDASDINANIKIMESIYRKCHLTHKIALSPTGGKLQAVATFCLKIMHPDIHIVYPVVREFAQDYTEGYLTHYEVFFQSFRDYVNDLNQYRMRDLAAIREILNNKTRKPAIG